ncbi:hypothetical protein FRIGORI9N_310097 [Frigoribacterium sp. 9N]|nr:hypothetical protein FRIGORI9N_310097 [Frigoribacterium sp. 9N]
MPRPRHRAGDRGPGTTKGPAGAGPLDDDRGRYRARTDDLFRVKEARYQLRQSPVWDSTMLVHRGARTPFGRSSRAPS